MQTLTVKNIEEKHTKDGTKSFFIITDSTGASFSLWEPIGMIKPGCVLEADIEVKGKYANIKNFTITSQPNIPQPDTQTKPPWKDNSASIETQVAVKEIGECWRAGKVTDDDGLVAVYKGWLAAKLGTVLSTPPSTPTASTPVAQKQAPASETKPPASLPLTAKAVYDRMVALVRDRTITSERGKAKAMELGGSGETAWDMTRSLGPDKLVELHEWLTRLSEE